MPHLEAVIPGFTAAVAVWLMNSTYDGPEDDEWMGRIAIREDTH